MTFMDIIGRDRGYNVGADVLTTTSDGVNLNSIWNEFVVAMQLQNDARSLIGRLFTFDTTDASDLLPLDGGGFEFEQQSEFGQPVAGRAVPEYYRIGFPLEWFDTATRFTRKYLRDATSEQVTSQHIAALSADRRQLFRKTLGALTSKSTSTSRLQNEIGIPIYSLYSGLSDDTPPAFAGVEFSAGHNHYLVSGATTVDSGDIEILINKIAEHGYGTGSGSRIVLMMNKQEADQVRTFRANVVNNNSAVAMYDFIASASAPAYLTQLTIVGEKPPMEFNGLPIIGSYGDALIFESPYMPAGYVIGVATGGPNSASNPLAFRQHPRAESQGLRLIAGTESSINYPLINSIYERGFGVGVRNRGAGAVMQIKATGSYVDPIWP